MSQRADALLQEALALPATERAEVATELLASLDSPSPEDLAAVQAAWAKEIERRARRVLSSDATGESWETVRERTARRLAKP